MIVKDFENIKDHINLNVFSMHVACSAGTTFWSIKPHIICDVVILLSKSPFQHILDLWQFFVEMMNSARFLWCVPLTGTGQCHKFQCFTLGNSTHFLDVTEMVEKPWKHPQGKSQWFWDTRQKFQAYLIVKFSQSERKWHKTLEWMILAWNN